MKKSSAIRQLISACADDESTLRHESENVDVGRRMVLTRLANERVELIDELRATRGDPEAVGSEDRSNRPSWSERLREFLRSLRVFAGGSDDGDAIAQCRRSLERARSAYERASSLPWAKEGLAILRKHAGRLQVASTELVAIQF